LSGGNEGPEGTQHDPTPDTAEPPGFWHRIGLGPLAHGGSVIYGALMKRIQALIRTNQLEDVLLALEDVGQLGVSVESTRGYGRQQGQNETLRGSTYALNLVPKTCLEIVTTDEKAPDVIEAIQSAARTGELGDGKIFVTEVLTAIRIRTGEQGDDAL